MAPVDCWNWVKGGRMEYKWKRSSLVSSMGSLCRYKRFYPCLSCSSQPSTKYFFPHLTTFSLYVSQSPSNLGRQACRVAYLLLCISGPPFVYRQRWKCIKSNIYLWLMKGSFKLKPNFLLHNLVRYIDLDQDAHHTVKVNVFSIDNAESSGLCLLPLSVNDY